MMTSLGNLTILVCGRERPHGMTTQDLTMEDLSTCRNLEISKLLRASLSMPFHSISYNCISHGIYGIKIHWFLVFFI